MFQQRFSKSGGNPTTPWSPLAVTLFALFIPTGGAVLTIRNLQRLNGLDARVARVQVYLVVAIFSLGLTVLCLLAQDGSTTFRQPNPDASLVLSVGTALASYLVQRSPYRSWRTSNARVRTASWWRALVTTVLYTLVIVLATACLFTTAYSVGTSAIVGVAT